MIVLFCLLVWFGFAVKAKATTQVTICHNTGQSGNYQKITVDWNAVDGQGNGDHNSSNHQNGRDIIPSGFWDSNGRNWDTQGQAIWNNNCNVPQPTPTHTVVPTVAPTATPQPTTVPSPTPEEPNPTPQKPTPIFSQPAPGPAPICGNRNIPFVPFNFHVLRNGSEAVLKWVPTGGELVNIFFKEVEQKGWTHAVSNEPNDGYVVVDHLNPNLGYEFAVEQHEGCGSGSLSPKAVVIDPPTTKWTLFLQSYWSW